jgi:hypothetical protein
MRRRSSHELALWQPRCHPKLKPGDKTALQLKILFPGVFKRKGNIMELNEQELIEIQYYLKIIYKSTKKLNSGISTSHPEFVFFDPEKETNLMNIIVKLEKMISAKHDGETEIIIESEKIL